MQPDFDGNNSFTKTITISPRTGSNTAAPTSYTIGTSDIDFNEADVTYESTEYFKLSLASADANAAVGSSDGATDEHYFALTNIDNKPIIILSDSDAGVTLYEQSSQGAKSHDFQFEVSSSGIQKSELPIHAYFTVLILPQVQITMLIFLTQAHMRLVILIIPTAMVRCFQTKLLLLMLQ